MKTKKEFKTYYLLLAEGPTEFNLFAYLTKARFKSRFSKSNIQFSNKVEIVRKGISQGKLNGASNLKNFKIKYDSIKKDDRYKGEVLFFILDKDLMDSLKIEKLIKKDKNIVQFLKYNSEYLLLKFAGNNLKSPSDFNDLLSFRNYCKREFLKQFKKKASDFNDPDFDLIFKKVEDEEIYQNFSELFSTLSF